jgi:Ca2+-binding EF-hand superfamily protein
MSNIDLARDIFNAWDVENKGYLTVEELTVQLMSLGLCTSRQFVERVLAALSKKGKKLELLTLKQFLKVFKYDKFGQSANQFIKKEFIQKQRQIYD